MVDASWHSATARLDALHAALSSDMASLHGHSIYGYVRDRDTLRRFMSAHVFAVWDFMTLLKSLQRRLTCVSLPWTRPASPRAARLINEIVLAEESDEVEPGRVVSHFELYLDAMDEVGCSTSAIRAVHDAVASGMDVAGALERFDVPVGVQRFVRRTLEVALRGSDVQVASEFLFGREDPIPAMFEALQERLAETIDAPSFRLYLRRHIEMDGEEHGPAAAVLLETLCGDDPERWAAATCAARAAVQARIALWDDLVEQLVSR